MIAPMIEELAGEYRARSKWASSTSTTAPNAAGFGVSQHSHADDFQRGRRRRSFRRRAHEARLQKALDAAKG